MGSQLFSNQHSSSLIPYIGIPERSESKYAHDILKNGPHISLNGHFFFEMPESVEVKSVILQSVMYFGTEREQANNT